MQSLNVLNLSGSMLIMLGFVSCPFGGVLDNEDVKLILVGLLWSARPRDFRACVQLLP